MKSLLLIRCEFGARIDARKTPDGKTYGRHAAYRDAAHAQGVRIFAPAQIGAGQRRRFQLPAMVMLPIRMEPVFFVPRHSTSLPMATMSVNMSFRLPAMVISSTGYWITPFSTQ